MTGSLMSPPPVTRWNASLSPAIGVDGMPAEQRPPVTTDELTQAVRQFGPRLHAVARRYFACEAEADDAVQDGLVAAIRHLSRFRHHSRLETWLHRIVVNACLMRLRAERRRPTIPLDEELSGPLTDHDPSVWDREEARHGVRLALRQLTESQQAVIRLRYFEGFNTAQTAELLGLTPEVVKTRLHRSCRALRRVLETAVGETQW
jgi:RNA polymerase sigma-70 factor, ECF subfamily